MVSPEVLKETLEKYIALVNAQDIEGLKAMYADDATVEDPVGTPMHSGKEAIEAFYANGLGAADEVSAELVAPIATTHAGEGAFSFQIKIKHGDHRMLIDVTDVIKLNAEGKIVSMRAFFSQEHNIQYA
ncbi:steroid delta-isomerase [Endozoicomonas sp. OPT23]|uniref:nuclear transport factor 2 family protein n=1 Tax=Endozoicomonas sp. OPT23 TaxID=2072845 RepID=UPI00129B8B63|nr:nuclear transport factor 2 family protein [Endozoicomonas sp. OPT23]MRI33963.1 steroid delta-isomerase [Endozoicomonas sp. OPT23]